MGSDARVQMNITYRNAVGTGNEFHLPLLCFSNLESSGLAGSMVLNLQDGDGSGLCPRALGHVSGLARVFHLTFLLREQTDCQLKRRFYVTHGKLLSN